MADFAHLIIDADAQVMRCEVCQEAVPYPLGPCSWAVAVHRAFSVQHPSTAHVRPGCKFSTPTKRK